MISETVEFPLNKRKFLQASILIGLGNPDRADDGIGIVCAKKINMLYYDLPVFTEDHDLVDEVLLKALNDETVKYMFFIDAADFGSEAGSVCIVDKPCDFTEPISSHKFPLAVYMKMLLDVGKCVKVIAVQPDNIEYKSRMSSKIVDLLNYDIISIFDTIIFDCMNN